MIKPSGANYKDDYARYLSKAVDIIHDPKTQPEILKMLSSKDSVQSVANVAVMIMQRIDAAARQSGIEIQDSVKALASAQIVNVVVETGIAAKKFTMDKELIELAISAAVQDYVKGEIASGRMNAKKVQIALQRDMRTMPPKLRKETMETMKRIQHTGRKYNGGQATPEPKGLIAGGAA
jgi:hypothetical protein